MKRITLSLVCIVFFALLTPVTHAQLGQGLNASNLVLSPRFPEPNEEVLITLNDYSLNTNGAIIQWFVDGVEVESARNLRSLTVTVGALATKTNVTAVTTLANGSKLRAISNIIPVRVDLLVEADTVAPVFYKGRTIPSTGSSVQVTAIPFTGTPRTPESFSYTWRVKDKVIGGGSRFGKNSITFTSEFGTQVVVSVDVFNADGSLVTTESIAIPLADPELYFYEINPLRGMSERVMDSSFIFIGDEIRVRAEPYFIEKSLLTASPFIEWKLDNRVTKNPSDDPQEITLRKSGEKGSFLLEFHIRNLKQLLQGVKDTIKISF